MFTFLRGLGDLMKTRLMATCLYHAAFALGAATLLLPVKVLAQKAKHDTIEGKAEGKREDFTPSYDEEIKALETRLAELKQKAAAAKQGSDPHAGKVIWTDSKGMKWYDFKVAPMPHSETRSFCRDKGLDLPTEKHVREVRSELGGQARSNPRMRGTFWTASLYSDNISFAWYFSADVNGYVSVAVVSRYNDFEVRCVGR